MAERNTRRGFVRAVAAVVASGTLAGCGGTTGGTTDETPDTEAESSPATGTATETATDSPTATPSATPTTSETPTATPTRTPPATTTQMATEAGLAEWFEDVDNYDGGVDMTGRSEVTVEVGVQNGTGAYGFGPAAVTVSTGTTVAWRWTGEGGSHNVVAEDDTFESDLYSSPGRHFSQTFGETGVFRYVCEPHRALGMKGAIVVRG